MTRKPDPTRVYTIKEAVEHPLAMQYAITERQFRRAVQSNRITYSRPGGLIVKLTDHAIRQFVLSGGNLRDAESEVQDA